MFPLSSFMSQYTGCLLQGKVRENLEKSGKKIISGKVRENKGKIPKTGKSQGKFQFSILKTVKV